MKCSLMNIDDKDKCKAYFSNYRTCMEFWVSFLPFNYQHIYRCLNYLFRVKSKLTEELKEFDLFYLHQKNEIKSNRNIWKRECPLSKLLNINNQDVTNVIFIVNYTLVPKILWVFVNFWWLLVLIESNLASHFLIAFNSKWSKCYLQKTYWI